MHTINDEKIIEIEKRRPARPVSAAEILAGILLRDGDGRLRKQADILVDIGLRHQPFHDPGGDGYAYVKRAGHTEVHALESRLYRELLAGNYYALTGKGCNRNSLADAITTLCAEARFKGECRPVWVRVASDNGDIAIDLGTNDWRIIRISKDGWHIEEGGRVMFRRAGKSLPLPLPADPQFYKLWRYLNVREVDRVLVAAFLLMALNPDGPYPVLILSGEQGTAKSSFAKIVKRFTDNSRSLLRSAPKEVRDLLVGALNTWLLCLDNLSWLPPEISDALCRLSTGGAIAERTLYSNLEETLVEVKRPVIVNGIEELATRPDLAERGIHIELETLRERRTEAELWAAFETDAPSIFAGLLDGIAMALRNVGTVKIDKLPRMADFALWAEAGLPALGFQAGEFMAAYTHNLTEGLTLGIESSAVGRALRAFMADRLTWTGTTADLLSELCGHASEGTQRERAWPRSSNALSGHLSRLGPGLRNAGVQIQRIRTGAARLVVLTKEPPLPPAQSSLRNDASASQIDSPASSASLDCHSKPSNGAAYDDSDANDALSRQLHDSDGADGEGVLEL